jgi:hypothetical protein
MSIQLPFANLPRLLAALAFGIVLMTASSCEECSNDDQCADASGDSAHCCHFFGKGGCIYEIGFRDSQSGSLEFRMVSSGYGFLTGYNPPDGFSCQDKISESCVECEGGPCPEVSR